jgi:hypothetical protein
LSLESQITGNRQGACIPASYEDLTKKFRKLAEKEKAFIVHGWMYSSSLKRHIRHAWIEFTEGKNKDNIYEVVKQNFIPKHLLLERDWLREVKRYTLLEIMKLSFKTNSRGGEFEFE